MDIVKDSGGWERIGKRKMLRLFHLAAEKVPAYRDFLNKSKIDPKKIKTFADFQAVPPVDKNNYLRAYPLEMLSCGGSLVKPLVFTSTSGSTGQPCYLYRDENLERQYSVILEKFFRNNKLMLEDPTLVIVAFGLGVWIGGVITYDALYALNRRFPFASSILATSIDKEQIIKALRELSPNYKQTILIGYPPFIKDIIDEARAENIHLNKLHLRLIFAAEPFTEERLWVPMYRMPLCFKTL